MLTTLLKLRLYDMQALCVYQLKKDQELLDIQSSMQFYNPEPLDDVLKIVHDYMDFHAIGAKIEMTTTKIPTCFKKILIKKKSHAAKVIQELFRSI